MVSESLFERVGLSTEEICSLWNIPPIVDAHVPSTGTMHTVLLLTTMEKHYVLRAYSYQAEKRWRIENEHAIAHYVQSQGLPAIAPLLLRSGETFVQRDGRFYALYPYAQGHQVSRNTTLSANIVSAMGRCLAQLHGVLASYPSEKVRPLSFGVDRQQTLEHIAAIESAITKREHISELDRQVLGYLERKRQYVSTASRVDTTELNEWPQQVLHGDYQETNLFFEGDQVSGIIDWDKACTAPRAWEILRTMHYVFFGEPYQCQLFLQAYRQVTALPFAEIDHAANVYEWVHANNLWVYSAYYLENNTRVQQWLQPKTEQPFAVRWSKVAKVLRMAQRLE